MSNIKRASSSDYTKVKRQVAVYSEVQRNATLTKSTNPLKPITNKKYNMNFGIMPPVGGIVEDCSGCCLKYANSYSLLSDYNNGKLYQTWLCDISGGTNCDPCRCVNCAEVITETDVVP